MASLFKNDHPFFADFTDGTIRTHLGYLLVPVRLKNELAPPTQATAVSPHRAKRTKPPLPHPPGPNDLGIVDRDAPDMPDKVRELAARILTDRQLEGVDGYSATVFRELFQSAAVRIVQSDEFPSTWDEVVGYLDDAHPGWESVKQIVLDLINGTTFDHKMGHSLLGMPEEDLSILLSRCRIVLRKALNDALLPAKQAKGKKSAPAPRSKKPTSVPVFSAEAIQRALATVGKMDEKMRPPAEQALNAACVNDGHRALPDVRKAIDNLDRLGRDFENLVEPIRHLRTELALASAMDPEEFRISPILLLGDPGIGKTHLALQLANALGVPMEKISAGSAQSGFQLTGSHPSWNRAMMGSVFQLLAEGASAAPVLVIDEVDKIGDGGSYPIVPALLDLLEHNTAKAFRDEFVDLRFDASRLVVVMTANEREAIPAPLLSRAALFDIPRPGQAQRRRIIETEIAGLVKKTRKRIDLDGAATDNLAARIDLDLRQTRRAVVEAFARALTNGEKTIAPKVPASVAGQRAMGFVR